MTGKQELAQEVDRLTVELDKARAKILKLQINRHYDGCWKVEGHHACAIVRVESLQAKMDAVNRGRLLFAQLNSELMKEIQAP